MKAQRFFSLFLVLTVVSCSKTTFLEITHYVNDHIFDEVKTEVKGEGYYREKEYSSLSYGVNKEKNINSLRDIYSSGINHFNAPSIGKVKALVIPINFLDSDISNNDKQKIIIHNAFFGRANKTTFESLASFYNYSSYGQLEIDGYVSDFYNYPYASNELGNGTASVSSKIALSALNWFYENNPDFDMSEYDIDQDGALDALYIVYNHPSGNDSNSLFWAYVDHMSKNVTYKDKPFGNTYAWIGYDFLDADNNYSETHVLIHETGHVFGLDDYYNTYASGHFEPTGYVDMMDRNIGDHTGYSKMLMDWVTPYVLNGTGRITIKPFSTSGNLILIPTNQGWNHTPYDEYLLLEYYTPTGLNKNDAGTKYYYTDINGDQNVFTFLNKPGLKIYHVDSRVGYFDSRFSHSLITTIGDENEKEALSGRSSYCLDFINDNSVLDNKINQPVLYHLLERSGENTLKDGIPFDSRGLFVSGDAFGVDVFKDFKFNNGSSLTHTFTILEENYQGITIEFTHIR